MSPFSPQTVICWNLWMFVYKNAFAISFRCQRIVGGKAQDKALLLLEAWWGRAASVHPWAVPVLFVPAASVPFAPPILCPLSPLLLPPRPSHPLCATTSGGRLPACILHPLKTILLSLQRWPLCLSSCITWGDYWESRCFLPAAEQAVPVAS